MTIQEGPYMIGYTGMQTLNRVRDGRCACCGTLTDDFRYIAEGVKMCNDNCLTHNDPATIHVILEELSLDLYMEQAGAS